MSLQVSSHGMLAQAHEPSGTGDAEDHERRKRQEGQEPNHVMRLNQSWRGNTRSSPLVIRTTSIPRGLKIRQSPFKYTQQENTFLMGG